MRNDPVVFAFILTLVAGLATGIGSTLAFLTRRTNTRFLSLALGFSAGVMIYVSFAEILVKARAGLGIQLGDKVAAWVTAGAFFGGIFLMALIDRLVPAAENPHEARRVEELPAPGLAPDQQKLMRMGILSAVAIGIHNFPEGLATFAAALGDSRVGIAIAAAVAIHNIPEGIAVAVPIYFATGNRRKAFVYSFLSGLSEPVGALAGYFLLMRFLGETTRGILFAAVAGIMVFISLDELLPTAREYGEHHLAAYGLFSGMALIALSLLLLL
jgi:zinc transporter, ZIP family